MVECGSRFEYIRVVVWRRDLDTYYNRVALLVSVGAPASHSSPHSATKIWEGTPDFGGGALHITVWGGEDPLKAKKIPPPQCVAVVAVAGD